jgi:hypothetical protein
VRLPRKLAKSGNKYMKSLFSKMLRFEVSGQDGQRVHLNPRHIFRLKDFESHFLFPDGFPTKIQLKQGFV